MFRAILELVFVIVVIFAAYYVINNGNLPYIPFLNSNLSTTIFLANYTSTVAPNQTTTVSSGNSTNLYQYALTLINNDRAKYGLAPVTLSNEPSGQQHTDSMLQNNYFSHWDIYGMKPYMRYTLVQGNGAVSENIAYESSSRCTLLGCSGNLNNTQAIQKMEYNMMYNDSTCCNNGHRYNILDPNHNQVSIGISYNASTIFFGEDFVDNYIAWTNPPGISDNTVYLQGTLQDPYRINSIQISFDSPTSAMSRGELWNTSSYGYGQNVAGVVSNAAYYYPSITTIDASRYDVNGKDFNIAFSVSDLISKYGAGEYTVMMWLDNQTGGQFVGSTYTIFVNSNNTVYYPNNV